MGYPNDKLSTTVATTVGTAAEGGKLEIIGFLPKQIPLLFSDQPAAGTLWTRPAVLRNLNMPFNISGPWMAENQVDQLHSEGVLQWKKNKIPLRPKGGDGAVRVGSTSKIYAQEDLKIPAKSITAVSVRIPALIGRIGEVAPSLHLASSDLRFLSVANIESDPANCEPLCLVINDEVHATMVRKGSLIGRVATTDPTAAADAGHEGDSGGDPIEVFKSALKHEDSVLDTASRQKRALDLLLQFEDVFSLDGGFGRTTLVKHDIHTGDALPIKSRMRPINPALEQNLRDQLDEWLKHDVIEPSSSPWSSALVAVKKKNGKTRWCVDFRRLNDVTVKDAYPLPLIEDNLARLAGSGVFTAVDGSGAFHVVELEAKAKPKTAFATPWGLFQFKRMPFGLCNAPATYSRLVQLALAGIPASEALAYMDDTLIHSATFEGHLHNLRKVLTAHRKAGLKLQPSKCVWFVNKTEYVGHEISANGIAPTTKYTEVVKNWPMPTTLTEARSFLGKVGYYRRFIERFAAIARPLTDATKEENLADKDKKLLAITPEMKKAHQQLKEALCSAPILAYPRFHDASPFIVDTDWSHSHQAIGGVLSQEQGGKERVIRYDAKRLSSSQRNYSAVKGEMFAIIYFLTKWKYYLQWRPFRLRTDHRALQWIRTMDPPDGMTSRWLETLANFQFTPEYRKGESHGNADGLSRAPHPDPIVEIEEDETLLAAIPDAEEDNLPRTKEEWEGSQECDPSLVLVKRELLKEHHQLSEREVRGWPVRARALWNLRNLLFIDPPSGLLMYQQGEARVPVIPDYLEVAFIKKAHLIMAHRGVDATMALVASRGLMLSGRGLVKEVLAACEACQIKSDRGRSQRSVYAHVPAGAPFQRISIDFVGPLRTTNKGNTCVLTVKDPFTKWVEAFPLARATAEAAAACLESEIFTRFGYPETIHSDRGRQFTGKLMEEIAELIGIRSSFTPPYHPQSNPVERAHRDLKSGLRAALIEIGHEQWDEVLPQVLFAFRIASARGTGFSPFELLFGRSPNVPLGAIEPPPEGKRPVGPYVERLRKRIKDVNAWARENLETEVKRQQRAYDQQRTPLRVGDRVWLHQEAAGLKRGERKLKSPWSGPYTIEEVVTPVLFRLSDDRGTINQHPMPLDRLRRYYPPQSSVADHDEPVQDVQPDQDPNGTLVRRRLQHRRDSESRSDSDSEIEEGGDDQTAWGPTGPGPVGRAASPRSLPTNGSQAQTAAQQGPKAAAGSGRRGPNAATAAAAPAASTAITTPAHPTGPALAEPATSDQRARRAVVAPPVDPAGPSGHPPASGRGSRSTSESRKRPSSGGDRDPSGPRRRPVKERWITKPDGGTTSKRSSPSNQGTDRGGSTEQRRTRTDPGVATPALQQGAIAPGGRAGRSVPNAATKEGTPRAAGPSRASSPGGGQRAPSALERHQPGRASPGPAAGHSDHPDHSHSPAGQRRRPSSSLGQGGGNVDDNIGRGHGRPAREAALWGRRKIAAWARQMQPSTDSSDDDESSISGKTFTVPPSRAGLWEENEILLSDSDEEFEL